MNVSYYIAKRIRFAQRGSFSRIASNLAVISISLGIIILIVTIAIFFGFKKTIIDKVYNFDADITVTKIDHFKLTDPLSLSSKNLRDVINLPIVEKFYSYGTVLGILQSNEEIEGIALFGVDTTFDKDKFMSNYFEGDFLSFKDKSEILVSTHLANRLGIKLGDRVLFNILSNKKIRHRWLHVKGIYRTDIEEVDQKRVIGDLNMVRRLYRWDSNKVEGIKISLKEGIELEQAESLINDMTDYDTVTINIKNEYLALFDWLKILAINVNYLIIIVIAVVFLNIMSIVLILIIERSSMIGVLKSYGLTNSSLRKIFLFVVLRITFKGLLIGNLIAGMFCLIQIHFHIIPLDPATYYMDSVPILWSWEVFLLLNVSVVLLVSAIVFVPMLIIGAVSPIKSIKFE